MISINEIDLNSPNIFFTFGNEYNEYILGNDELLLVKGESIDKSKERDEFNSNKDSTKETFPKENNKKEIQSEKVQKKEHKNMGRKRKNSQLTWDHNKNMDDNVRRKIKHLFIKNLLQFINEKIKEKYQSFVGKGVFIKQLLIINQKQIDDATVLFNRELLNKSIGDIFSENISTRYTKYPLSHNRNLINSLRNEKDINRKNYFNNLFDLSFMESLEHFRKSKVIEELNGMKTFDLIKQDFKDDEDYLKILDYSIENYEKILYYKRIRKQKKR